MNIGISQFSTVGEKVFLKASVLILYGMELIKVRVFDGDYFYPLEYKLTCSLELKKKLRNVQVMR